MDLNKIIRELREERNKLDRIVSSLEQLESATGNVTTLSGSRRGRRSMNAEAREEVSRRMKNYWASRRESGSGASS